MTLLLLNRIAGVRPGSVVVPRPCTLKCMSPELWVASVNQPMSELLPICNVPRILNVTPLSDAVAPLALTRLTLRPIFRLHTLYVPSASAKLEPSTRLTSPYVPGGKFPPSNDIAPVPGAQVTFGVAG